jgi:hypothetical protein
MIPTSCIIAYFLLGIEELAVQMEEPFSILPMEKMTGGIRLSADEHVDWKRFTPETLATPYMDPYAGGYSGEYSDGADTNGHDGGDTDVGYSDGADTNNGHDEGDTDAGYSAPPAIPNPGGNVNDLESFLRGQ